MDATIRNLERAGLHVEAARFRRRACLSTVFVVGERIRIKSLEEINGFVAARPDGTPYIHHDSMLARHLNQGATIVWASPMGSLYEVKLDSGEMFPVEHFCIEEI